MDRRPLDPRLVPVSIDSSALHRDGGEGDNLVDRLVALGTAGSVRLIVPKGVRTEVLDPKAPLRKQQDVMPMIFTLDVGLNSDEQRRHDLIERELQGNARPGKHAADADHLFEAAKYGGYFITRDHRILTKAGNLSAALPPRLCILTPDEFLAIYDGYVNGADIQ